MDSNDLQELRKGMG